VEMCPSGRGLLCTFGSEGVTSGSPFCAPPRCGPVLARMARQLALWVCVLSELHRGEQV